MPYKIKKITETTYLPNYHCKQRYIIIVAIVIFKPKERAVGADNCD